MQLTKNFKSEEFVSAKFVTSIVLSDIQMFMISNLASKILQPIRNVLNVSIQITSGIRIKADYDRLKTSGYNPSETSDHFYGISVPIYNPLKIAKFGDTYSFSVGAVDFVPTMDLDKAFNMIVMMVKNSSINPGQLIKETGNGMSWIHISNHPSLIYSPDFCSKFLNRSQILTSNDAGKTYISLT